MLRINVGFLLKEGIGYTRELSFDEPVVELADDLTVSRLVGSVALTRTPQGLYAHGQLCACTTCDCARCLDPFEQTVQSRVADLFHYPPENAPEGELAVSDDVHLDLTPLVREDLLLSIPMHALCRPDCKGLCPECGQNWNEGPCNCRPEARDPRFAALTALLKQEASTPK